MRSLLEQQLGPNTGHDFDTIDQSDCRTGPESDITIDVDRLLGRKAEVGETVEYSAEEYGEYYGDYEAEVLSAEQLSHAMRAAAAELEFSQTDNK